MLFQLLYPPPPWACGLGPWPPHRVRPHRPWHSGSIENSDVTFVLGDARLEAHAAILCVRSEVFARELASGFRKSTSKEIDEAVLLHLFRVVAKVEGLEVEICLGQDLLHLPDV